MKEFVLKKIDKNDKNQVLDLINIVINGLEQPEFFIPYSEWELNNLFNEDYAPINGAYYKNKLIGMTQLYVQEEMLKEYIEILGLNSYKVCELGGALVLPEYRNKGIMTNLLKMQCELAKELGFDYIISMAHPDNIASNKALMNVGLEYVKTHNVNNGFSRKIYCMKVN